MMNFKDIHIGDRLRLIETRGDSFQYLVGRILHVKQPPTGKYELGYGWIPFEENKHREDWYTCKEIDGRNYLHINFFQHEVESVIDIGEQLLFDFMEE